MTQDGPRRPQDGVRMCTKGIKNHWCRSRSHSRSRSRSAGRDGGNDDDDGDDYEDDDGDGGGCDDDGDGDDDDGGDDDGGDGDGDAHDDALSSSRLVSCSPQFPSCGAARYRACIFTWCCNPQSPS